MRQVPDDFRGDDQLLVGHVISELRQEVHVRQLLPKLVTILETGSLGDEVEGTELAVACSYLIRGLKMFHTMRMKLVGWTTYSAFRFFLYLQKNK